MSGTHESAAITCEDCYFRQRELCALPKSPCPTFRPARTDVEASPPQPRLVRRERTRRYELVAA